MKKSANTPEKFNKIMNTTSNQTSTATTEGSNPEVRTNGKEIRKTYHDNGELKSKESYKDGELDGPFEYHRPNGRLLWKSSLKNGELDGPFEDYFENGQLRSKESFNNGGSESLWESYHSNGPSNSPSL